MINQIPLNSCKKQLRALVLCGHTGVAAVVVDNDSPIGKWSQRRLACGIAEGRRFPPLHVGVYIIIGVSDLSHGGSFMEKMRFLRDQIIPNPFRVKRHHIRIQSHAVGKELPPVIVSLSVIIDEYGRIDPAAEKLYRIGKGPFRAVGNSHSLAIIGHTEIEIIFSVTFQAVRRK